jgi:hypothetical protein
MGPVSVQVIVTGHRSGLIAAGGIVIEGSRRRGYVRWQSIPDGYQY